MPEYEPLEVLRQLVGMYPSWRRMVGMTSNACIAAARIGNEVLAYFGITSIPLPVAIQVHNPKLAELQRAGVTVVDPDELALLGAYALGTDPDVPPKPMSNGWNCHLVLWVPDHRMVLDLTLEQYSREAWGIKLGAGGFRVVEEATEPFLAGRDWLPVTKPEGTRVLYLHRPDQQGYRQAPDWKRGKYRQQTGQLIRTVRAGIAGEASAARAAPPEA